ncbi:MAG: hypothetical protein M1820_008996 [Bogoriella megaspora]|nr:MAG: hypothetical protein M1820_008996 [Bogoriella megaspora]
MEAVQVQVFEDLPRIDLGDMDYMSNSYMRFSTGTHFLNGAYSESGFFENQSLFGVRSSFDGSTMSRYLEAPDQNPLLTSIMPTLPPQKRRSLWENTENCSYRPVEQHWPPPYDRQYRQSSPDSTTWSASSRNSFSQLGSDDIQPFHPSSSYSPRSVEKHWRPDANSGSELGDTISCNDGNFAEQISCISLCEIQQYPDASEDETDVAVIEMDQAARASNIYAPYPAEVDLAETEDNYDERPAPTTSEEGELPDADGETVDEEEGEDHNDEDETYEPRRKLRSSTTGVRRRYSHQQKPKTPTRAHKRSASSVDTNNKITKTSSSRPRCKTQVKTEPASPTHNSNSNSSTVRPFPCPLAPYSCTSAFGSKNEWKRHISSQHLRLGFWRCDICGSSGAERPNDFNRKDLFTQHLRRMHQSALKDSSSAESPAATSKVKTENQADSPSTSEAEAQIVKRCYHALRDPPLTSSCLFCTSKFTGQGSWEERVEHVGKHLEGFRKEGKDPLPADQWAIDKHVEEWLEQHGMVKRGAKGWEIGDGMGNQKN